MVISNLKIGTSYFFTPLAEFAKENIRYLVALSDVGYSGHLAVVAVIARDILTNTAQEQAHVFRATMMLPTGCLTGVPCCAGRALAAEFILSEAEGPEGRARYTGGPPGPSGFDP